MKLIICLTATAALLAFASVSHARTPSSSFVPRGPQPHSSLSDKHHSKKGNRSGAPGTTHKAVHTSPKSGSRVGRSLHSN
ncbi:MAG TPA: hypothetical protein VGI32_12695 [Steroidobacteraceae bacterium]